MHGFEISSWLEARSVGALDVEDSALYQALHRMEQRGLISAEWGVTANNRRARYYQPTPQGVSHLQQETVQWSQYARVVSDILAESTPA